MFEFFLNLLFPKRCVGCKRFGSFICSVCFAKIAFVTAYHCPVCNKPSIDGKTHPVCKILYSIDGVCSSIVYQGIVKKLLYQFKYQPYLSSLTTVLSELLYEGVIQHEVFYHFLESKPLITAVPLSTKKLRKRGYNHAELLAGQFAKRVGLLYYPSLVIRIKDTTPQFFLKREERIRNIKGAFIINPKSTAIVKNRNVVIIDDIATTFSTLSECANILKRNGAKTVWGAVLAREE